MIKLNKAQLAVLSAAAQCRDRAVAFPEEMARRERAELVRALTRKGLIEEAQSNRRMPVHRLKEGERKMALVVTPACCHRNGVDASEGIHDDSIQPAVATAAEVIAAPQFSRVSMTFPFNPGGNDSRTVPSRASLLATTLHSKFGAALGPGKWRWIA